ncbi:hypothetical protein [Anaeromicropila herbilytica]|uniref:Uncharacterized protein n=1 Tax=Anaeromicropila herbilytica TaxID=2785025 RepID=A0A7R7ENF9_9FIRM|nr:hypothetical protein [Anaeromicropila herbilytica]BCN32064.1 hypothetical protein bsdtb5_33590 [Anaeromicropila herbilytica]
MNGYEKIIRLMQQQSKSPSSIFLATMDTNSSCKVNGLNLDSEDLLIAEPLKTGYYTKDGDASKFIEPVKANDLVLVLKMNEEQYAIIERLVNL